MKETYYLMETEDGMTVRVPESRLDEWEAAQKGKGKMPAMILCLGFLL